MILEYNGEIPNMNCGPWRSWSLHSLSSLALLDLLQPIGLQVIYLKTGLFICFRVFGFTVPSSHPTSQIPKHPSELSINYHSFFWSKLDLSQSTLFFTFKTLIVICNHIEGVIWWWATGSLYLYALVTTFIVEVET